MSAFKEGDRVRVRRPDQYIKSQKKKYADRLATVTCSFIPLGGYNRLVKVTFDPRRKGGKVLTETFPASELESVP